ncbi:hypothetical protein D4Q52_15355 [Rhodopseudomonas palustris]|uniref:Uncharacterized protein n=1 Tax=Rhodopseudomonas palustris TaxID=1076 RepID=A0A418V3P8_RHOPL|nr:hypothetical protein D4Q52_15355 [Rhodopseudomonas palustris]
MSFRSRPSPVIARSTRIGALRRPGTGSATKQSSAEQLSFWMASRSLSSGGASRRPVGSQ